MSWMGMAESTPIGALQLAVGVENSGPPILCLHGVTRMWRTGRECSLRSASVGGPIVWTFVDTGNRVEPPVRMTCDIMLRMRFMWLARRLVNRSL